MKTVAEFKRWLAANAPGVTLSNDDERGGDLTVEAPVGFTLDGDLHQFVVQWGKHGGGWGREKFDYGKKSDALADAVGRFSLPLQPCTDPNCDYCHPVEQEMA